MFKELFYAVCYKPILNLLVVIYNNIPGHDLAIAIILITILIKLFLWPFSRQAIRAQKELQELQPKLEEIKKTYSSNKEEQAKATMALYREHKINPFSSCLPLLVQLPFFFAVFQVFREISTNSQILGYLYNFVSKPESINPQGFFGLINLAEPSYLLAVSAGLAQFWQAKMLSSQRPPTQDEGAKDEDFAAVMNKQMLYMMPALTVFIGITLPAGLSLYWLVMTLLTVLQQFLVFRMKKSS
ncbi:membrane protein insertase YidC [Candidatus Falkowbacteria bacterium]|nr:membrane protein insertase YidC [Candidatus Falkowbacteria bacterium]